MFFLNSLNVKANTEFRDLKTFISTQWFCGNRKNYRSFFDKSEVGFLYAEFSFINKLFTRRNWKANVTLKAYKCFRNSLTEICTLDKKINISKDDQIIFVREGWGTKTLGGFWEYGDYKWVAYIENVQMGECNFYIDNAGLITEEHNPYFDVESVRLYEGPNANLKKTDRTYAIKFDCSETRYVWTELKIKNKSEKDWVCEIKAHYLNQLNYCVGEIDKIILVDRKLATTDISVGWGSDTKGTWQPGNFHVDLICMDSIVATTLFTMH